MPEPLEVVIEHGRVWIRRGVQSFMADYDPEGDEDAAPLEWFAERVREVVMPRSGLDPEMGFLLEGANEGEWAAYEHGCREMEAALARILDGEDTGAGIARDPWETLRRRVLALKDRAERKADDIAQRLDEKSRKGHPDD